MPTDAAAAATTTTTAKPAEGDAAAAAAAAAGGAAATKTGEGKAAEGTTTEGMKEAPKDGALKFPEGFSPDTAKEISELAAATGLKGEAAQKFAESLMKRDADNIKSMQDHIAQLDAKWTSDIKADKDLGGANYDATMRHANAAVERFGSPELKKAFNETRFGNHPEVVRMMSKIGKAIAEDTISGGNNTAATDDSAELAASLYTHPTSAKTLKK